MFTQSPTNRAIESAPFARGDAAHDEASILSDPTINYARSEKKTAPQCPRCFESHIGHHWCTVRPPSFANGAPFQPAIFPSHGTRFTAPNGQVWKVGTPPTGQYLRPNMIYATRGAGGPGTGFYENYFQAHLCTPLNGAGQ